MTLIALFKLDNDYDDDSGSNLPAAPRGDPTFVTGQLDGAIGQNTGMDDVRIPTNPIFDFGTSDYSIACWVRTAQITGATIIGRDHTGTGRCFLLDLLANHALMLYYFNDSGSGFARLDTATGALPDDGSFHHVAGVREGNNLRIHVDGTQVASGLTSGAHGTMNGGTTPVTILSRDNTTFRNFLDGDVDDARLYNHAILQSEIDDLQDPYRPLGLWKFDDDYLDSSHNALPTAPRGTPVFVAGEFGSAVSQNTGTDDVRVSTNPIFNFGDRDFSIACWVRTASTAASTLVGRDHTGTGRSFVLDFLVNRGLMLYYFNDSGSGFGRLDTAINVVPDDGGYHHVVAQRQQNNLRIFVDSSEVASGLTSGAHGTMTSGTTPVTIMARDHTTFRHFYDGDIDDVRLYNYALSQDEINVLLNPYPSPGIGSRILLDDVAIEVDLEHDRLDQVTIEIEFPDGPRVTLMNAGDVGLGETDFLTSVRFWDKAEKGMIAEEVAPYSGDYKPATPLLPSIVGNDDPNGDWTLHVNAVSGDGTLSYWEMHYPDTNNQWMISHRADSSGVPLVRLIPGQYPIPADAPVEFVGGGGLISMDTIKNSALLRLVPEKVGDPLPVQPFRNPFQAARPQFAGQFFSE